MKAEIIEKLKSLIEKRTYLGHFVVIIDVNYKTKTLEKLKDKSNKTHSKTGNALFKWYHSIVILLVLLLLTSLSFGQTCDPCYAIVNGGNWSDPNTWSDTPGGSATTNVPGNTTDVHIGESGAITVNLDVDSDSDNLTIYGNSVLQYTAAGLRLRTRGGSTLDLQANGTIDGNGQNNADITVRGDFILNGSTSDLRRIQTNSGNDIILSGSGTLGMNASNGELRITGTGTVTNNISTTMSMVRLRFNSDANLLVNNGNIQCSELRLYGTNALLTNNGTLTITSQIVSNNDTDDGNTLTNTNTISLTGNFNMSNADFTINNSGTFTHTGDFLNVGGTETLSNLTGGTWTTTATTHANIATINCSATNNSFVYDLAGDQDVFIPSDGSYYNLTVQNSGTKTAIGTLNIDNDFTIGGSAIMEMSTNNADLNISGNYSNAGGTFNEGTQTISLVGSGTQSIDNTSASETFYNLVINKPSGAVNMGGSLTALTVQDFTLSSTNSGTFSGPATHTINGNISIESGNGATWTGGTTINLFGNWTNNSATGDFDANNGSLQLVGASTQTIGGSASTNFYDLTLNNATGFLLASATTAQNALTMTSGNVDLATFTLTLGTAAATPGTLIYTAGELSNGSFTRWYDAVTVGDGNVAGLFPMADANGNTRPFYVTPATAPATGGTITVSVTTNDQATDIGPIDDNGTDIVRQHQASWDVSTGGGLAGGDDYNLRGGGTGFGTIDAVSDLRLMTNSGVVGTDGGAGGTTSNPLIDRTGLTLVELANSFHVGSINETDSPLPIKLLSFDAKYESEHVLVEWSTATETDNDFFSIERSSNGVDYYEIGRVDGAGHSTKKLSYNYIDYQPLIGKSFYRLRQTDFDGKTEVFAPVIIESNLKLEFSLYPNPMTTSQFTIVSNQHVDSPRQVGVFDQSGRNIPFLSTSNGSLLKISPVENLKTGIYIVSIQYGDMILNQRLVVK